MKHALSALFAPLAVAACLSPVQAADITHELREGERSAFRLLDISYSGAVEPGDADTIRRIVDESGVDEWDDFTEIVISLDSPGGSFAEAVRLMTLFRERNIATYVGENADCLSACAVAFMAGTTSAVNSRALSRTLHPTARLGFHAPSLSVPAGRQVESSELGRAYDVALRTMAELVDRMSDLDIPPSLISTMLATPPDDMFVLRTVDDTNRWKIDIDTDDRDWSPTAADIVNACNNTEWWREGLSAIESHDRSANYAIGQAEAMTRQSLGNATVSIVRVNEENGNTCFAVPRNFRGTYLELFYSTSNPDDVVATLRSQNVVNEIARLQHGYAPDTLIAALPEGRGRATLPPDTDDPNTDFGRFCEIFERSERVRSGPCDRFLRNGTMHHAWADGTVERIRNLGNGVTWNDEPAEPVFSMPGDRSCVRSEATRLMFCHAESQLSYEALSADAPAGRFDGQCKDSLKWLGVATDDGARAGLYACGGSAGAIPIIEFTCASGDNAYRVYTGIGVPPNMADGPNSTYFLVGRTGMLFEGTARTDSSDGSRDFVFELPLENDLVPILSRESGGSFSVGVEKFEFHLSGSSKSLDYLKNCW